MRCPAARTRSAVTSASFSACRSIAARSASSSSTFAVSRLASSFEARSFPPVYGIGGGGSVEWGLTGRRVEGSISRSAGGDDVGVGRAGHLHGVCRVRAPSGRQATKTTATTVGNRESLRCSLPPKALPPSQTRHSRISSALPQRGPFAAPAGALCPQASCTTKRNRHEVRVTVTHFRRYCAEKGYVECSRGIDTGRRYSTPEVLTLEGTQGITHLFRLETGTNWL